MKKYLLLLFSLITYLGYAQCVDPTITDFECSAPSHPITGALITVTNPFPHDINRSANVGRYTDDGTQGFDALVIDYGTPIDLSVNPVLKLKFYSTSSVQILAKLEGGTPQEIFSDFSQANNWQEFSFDFSASQGNNNTRVVFFVNPGVSSGTTADFYYLDDILFDNTVLTPCEEPFITNFECAPSSTTINGALVTVGNSVSGGINTSPNIGQYTDNGTAGFDALVIDYGTPIDLSVNNLFKIKFYSPTSVQILAKLEGGNQQELFSDFSQVNTWEEFVFDFSASQGQGNTRLVLFFNPNVTTGTPNDIYYIDELQFGTIDRTIYSYKDDATGWTPNEPSNAVDLSTAIDNVLIQGGTGQAAGNVVAANVTVATGAAFNAQGLNISTSLDSQGNTNIFGILTPNSAQLNTNGNLTLKSNATGTASVADATNATFNGTVTVERYIPASNRAYRLLSTPVQNAGNINTNWQLNTHITGTGGASNGFDATSTNQPSMFTVNENAAPANYEAISSTNATVLSHGTGYLTFIRGDRSIDLTSNNAAPTATTLSATGTIFKGAFNLAATELNTGDFQAGGNGSSLIANPYQAPVNMEQVLNSASQINPEFIHVYDPSLGERGAFVTVGFGTATDGSQDQTNFTFGTNMGTNASPTNASRFVQAGSALFVNTINPGTDGTASPTIAFNETDKVVSSSNLGTFSIPSNESSDSNNAFINIALFDTATLNNNGNPRDGLTIRFSDTYSNEIELFDAYKATNLDENFASQVDGKDFSIQGRALPLVDEIVNLSIKSYTKTDYTMSAHANGFENTDAYLLDGFLNTRTLLKNNNETRFQFSVDPNNPTSMASDRFSLVFEKSTLSTTDNLISDFRIFPNPVIDGQLFFESGNDQLKDAKINLYNLLGQKLSSYNLDNLKSTKAIDVSNLTSGVYVLELSANGTSMTKKIIVQ